MKPVPTTATFNIRSILLVLIFQLVSIVLQTPPDAYDRIAPSTKATPRNPSNASGKPSSGLEYDCPAAFASSASATSVYRFANASKKPSGWPNPTRVHRFASGESQPAPCARI